LKPERWQEISLIFKSALSVDPEARAAFIQRRCGTDESLRKQVEELVESHQRATDEAFIAGAAAHDAAGLVVYDEEEQDRRSVLEDGQTFGSYLILGTLGAGGMGEVYLAKDLRLDRTVALKILPPELAGDERRMQRFRQEARVASSLNQPNILTIFEFGEVDSRHFLAAEYVDGETLRDFTRSRQLKLSEILDISIQVLAAIEAAHEAKIVHRDIKPENVMIRRRDRIVKVLDFGLAKLTEKTSSSVAESLEAATQFKTAAGSVLGTVSYMSPEQAQGLQVDVRTDIWSAGVMIYEMVAGTLPFKGLTSSHTIVQILEKDPLPLTQLENVKVPAELQRIVSKSMAKNGDERYQSAKDMLIDLRNLKKRSELDAEIERSVSPHSDAVAATTDKNTIPRTEPIEAERTRPELSESDRGRRNRWVPVTALILVLIAGLIIAANWSQLRRSTVVAPAPPLTAATERTLSYWMTVQKYRNGQPFENPFRLAGEINFEKDYRVRLNVSSSQSGYLYILNEGPPPADGPGPQPASPAGVADSSSLVVLFPSTTANDGLSYLAANQRVEIPQLTWFAFDAEQGTEKVWLVFSANAVPELEAVKRFANPKDRGLIKDAGLNARVEEFLKAHSDPKAIIEKDDELKQTSLKIGGDLLVHAIKLEHH
jgi:serine/threonine protein kinase